MEEVLASFLSHMLNLITQKNHPKQTQDVSLLSFHQTGVRLLMAVVETETLGLCTGSKRPAPLSQEPAVDVPSDGVWAPALEVSTREDTHSVVLIVFLILLWVLQSF